MRDIHKYEVFKLADELVPVVYQLTSRFPKDEMFGLTSQMRRAATSIPMNLAEGAARSGAREFAQAVNMAVGSCEEVRYQVHLARVLGYMSAETARELDNRYEVVKKMLARLLARVSGR